MADDEVDQFHLTGRQHIEHESHVGRVVELSAVLAVGPRQVMFLRRVAVTEDLLPRPSLAQLEARDVLLGISVGRTEFTI